MQTVEIEIRVSHIKVLLEGLPPALTLAAWVQLQPGAVSVAFRSIGVDTGSLFQKKMFITLKLTPY